MTDKELRKLNRAELLEMLLVQTERVEELEAKLKETEESYEERLQLLESKLEDRKLKIERAGSIAEAALSLNHVFEAAQQAADQYLENIRDLYYQQEMETLKETP